MMPKNLATEFLLQRIIPALAFDTQEKNSFVDIDRAGQVAISGITLDSRQVKRGDIFCAIRGEKMDGKEFIAKAIAQGASAVLIEVNKELVGADKHWQPVQWIDAVPVIAVENLPQKLSAIAGEFYAHPSRASRLVGVTGTNGKTTCTLLIAQLVTLLHKQELHKQELKSARAKYPAGVPAGVVGTLGFGLLDAHSIAPIAQQMDAIQNTGLTTPDAINLQRILATLVQEKATTIAIEVSSHALVLGRVAALSFETALFTNLTQDHLDFHGDLKSYGAAKARLLQCVGLKNAVINLDDAWAQSLVAQAPQAVKLISFSIRNPQADLYLSDIQLNPWGVTAQLHSPWGEAQLNTPFLGEFNLSNLLGVIAVVMVAEAEQSKDVQTLLEKLIKLIPQLQAAPGRMQNINIDSTEQDISVVVDYAHTPDALENTLQAIRQHASARLWTVFGCGGDRDKTKRPLMGRIAESLSDCVLVTNDNPRTEDPASIAADIVRGMNNPNACVVLADRAQAIDFAVQQAKSGDVVLIAGKGHEDYQIFADQTLPFSDIKQARLALQKRIAKREKQSSQNQHDIQNRHEIKGAQL